MLKLRFILWGALAVSVCAVFAGFSFYGGTENPVPSTKMYWTDFSTLDTMRLPCSTCRGRIMRANVDGTGVEEVVTGLGLPEGIALDLAAGKVYWTEAWFPGLADSYVPKIQRANLDGTEIQSVFPDLRRLGVYSPGGIALDVAAGKVYWTDTTVTRSIQRANFDGMGFQHLVTHGIRLPLDVKLDPPAGKMYWSDSDTGKIQRANLDGTHVEDLVTLARLNAPRGIALDVTAGKVYWALVSEDARKIQRANLDGTDVEDLVIGLDYPEDIELDVVTGKMYWTDRVAGKIQRANLDGSGVEDLVTGLHGPKGIALGH